jgi:dTMP kinase
VLLTREPGGTVVGTALRSIVLDPATGELSPRTEALLYAADKAEHVDAVVLPALQAGTVVLTDRYVDSTLAYQGAGRALSATELEPVARWATRDLRPQLTVLLDVDPRTGTTRFTGRDRLESEPMEFHDRVREEFLELAAADPEHYLVVDAGGDVHTIAQRVRAAVEPLLSAALR